MKTTRVAIPSMTPGGLDAQRSGHFGRCDIFTIIDIKDGKIDKVDSVSNVEHSEGGCLVPVNLLANHAVNVIIVGGMGMRPLMGFRQAGIEVYIGDGNTVNDSIQGYLDEKLNTMTDDYVCGGH